MAASPCWSGLCCRMGQKSGILPSATHQHVILHVTPTRTQRQCGAWYPVPDHACSDSDPKLAPTSLSGTEVFPNPRAHHLLLKVVMSCDSLSTSGFPAHVSAHVSACPLHMAAHARGISKFLTSQGSFGLLITNLSVRLLEMQFFPHSFQIPEKHMLPWLSPIQTSCILTTLLLKLLKNPSAGIIRVKKEALFKIHPWNKLQVNIVSN